MLVEEHNIHLVALQLSKELVGHIVVVHTEVELLEGSMVVAAELRENLVQHHALVHPRNQTVRVVCSTCEGYHIINLLLTLTLGNHLAKILSRSLILVATHLLGVVDTARIERGVEVLGRVLRELVVVTKVIHRVALDELEREVQIIVETVRCNRSLVDGETLLIHLEGCGHMLCVLHANVRYIADEYTTLQRHLLRVALVELRKLGTYLLGRCPISRDGIYGQAVLLQRIAVSSNLGVALLVCRSVDNYGKRCSALLRGALNANLCGL